MAGDIILIKRFAHLSAPSVCRRHNDGSSHNADGEKTQPRHCPNFFWRSLPSYCSTVCNFMGLFKQMIRPYRVRSSCDRPIVKRAYLPENGCCRQIQIFFCGRILILFSDRNFTCKVFFFGAIFWVSASTQSTKWELFMVPFRDSGQ